MATRSGSLRRSSDATGAITPLPVQTWRQPDAPIVIDKDVNAHGYEQSVVLYWYQSHNRVIARRICRQVLG